MANIIKCPFCKERVTKEDLNLGYHKSACDKEFPKIFLDKYIQDEDENIFSINKKINKEIDYFTLDKEEQKFYFSLIYYLINLDTKDERKISKKKNKKEWLRKWEKSINTTKLDDPIITDEKILRKGLKQLAKNSYNEYKMGNILLELYTFRPYFPLEQIKNEEKLKELKKLKYNKKRHNKEWLSEIYNDLNFKKDLFNKSISNYKKAIKKIAPAKRFKKRIIAIGLGGLLAVLFGVAAPIIGTIIGGYMGLAGAAATSAGLAFLGGGAIAAGGLGMAGGTAVLIGGGAILGFGAGSQLTSFFSLSSDLYLDKLAKLESVTLTFTIEKSNLKKQINLSINKIREIKNILNTKEIEIEKNLKGSSNDEEKKLKKKLKQTRKSIKYCNKAIDRFIKFRP